MKEAQPNRPLGEYIRRHRLRAKLSIPAAAGAAGVDASFWRKLELGQYESPSPKMLAPIARTIGATLADLYALAGYEPAADLPALRPYLRSKYQLPPKAVAELERYFTHLRNSYGIPKDQPVFPPKPRPARKPGPKDRPEPTGGPWDDPSLKVDIGGTS